jgi:hypothetical protein
LGYSPSCSRKKGFGGPNQVALGSNFIKKNGTFLKERRIRIKWGPPSCLRINFPKDKKGIMLPNREKYLEGLKFLGQIVQGQTSSYEL